MAGPKIAIAYYSMYGHIRQMVSVPWTSERTAQAVLSVASSHVSID